MSVDDQVGSSSSDAIQNVLTIPSNNILTISRFSPTGNVDLDLKNELQEEEEGMAVSPGALLASQGYLVSPSLNNPTLQSLLTSPTALQGPQLGLPEGIQIITVSSPSSLLPTQTDGMGRIWHVINPDDTIIAVGNEDLKQLALANGEVLADVDVEQVTSTTGTSDQLGPQTDIASELMPPPMQILPPGCPAWAATMKNVEKIGDYYRGYVDTEVELDILLTYHKQATQSFWGTRQSPSPAKQSTRFMWKSQYVPYDGIPFVNTGSRAVVMECQYGPRRKASLAKKQIDNNSSGEYKQTCPARIYIKKVRKFPEYKIDPGLDKKVMKSAMDKAFHALKQQNIEKIGQDRFYVQLPLQSAHEFHDTPIVSSGGFVMTNSSSVGVQVSTHTQTQESESGEVTHDESEGEGSSEKRHRLNPMVVQKIRDIVAGGEVRVYHVRRLLRMYVCQELLNGQLDSTVSRHDLSLFPTVTDLKNHIHQAVKDIENGTLALTAPTVNVEPMTAGNTDDMIQLGELTMLPQDAVVSSEAGVGTVVPETVTVTLTQSPGEEGGHVISRIETHMSDGTTQISTSLTPETAQLLARLNPAMFPPGSLVQLKAENESQVSIQAVSNNVTLNSSAAVDTNTYTSINGSSALDTHTYTSMDMEGHGHEESLTIQSTQDHNSLTIPVLEGSQVPTSIMAADNPSLSEQSSQLINVSIVPNGADDLEDMQTDSCDEDL